MFIVFLLQSEWVLCCVKLAAPLKIHSTTATQDIFIIRRISIRIVKFYAEGRRLAHGILDYRGFALRSMHL